MTEETTAKRRLPKVDNQLEVLLLGEWRKAVVSSVTDAHEERIAARAR
jgi:hypothetical protein